MTNISKQHLPDKEFQNLYKQFSLTVSKLNTKGSHEFFSDFFTPSEKVMFTKRLAAVVMIHKGYSTYRVWTSLQLSSATAKKLFLMYEQGYYEKLLKHFDKQKQTEKIWEKVELVLRAGMPEQGKGRWKWLDN